MSEQTICGRTYEVQKRGEGIKPRFFVDGVNHPGGVKPIRFKSLDRAERHIRNMRLEK